MFAWAATMLYAATSRNPFGSDTLPAVIQRVLHTEPDVSALPGGLPCFLGVRLSFSQMSYLA
jgi:eukaryotic-like serine/threonine-protein kinase